MTELLIALIVVLALLAGYLAFQLARGRRAEAPDQSLVLLQNRMSDLTRTLDTRLAESAQVMREQAGQSGTMLNRVTRDVLDRLGKVSEELVRVGESNRQMVSIADQLKHLQDILKNPKQRGTLGEYHLETALMNSLPPGTYQMQYPFRDGTKVDAVIFYAEKVIPIDSKFSLENYTRLLAAQTDDERARYETALRNDLKTRIDETAKYIKPAEDTLEFAFMFIPSEALYYDLLINKVGSSGDHNLIEYAIREKRVHIVSPTTIYAYLQTIQQGLRYIQINKSTEQIRKGVGELVRHFRAYDKFMQKLGNHLQTSGKAYSDAYLEFRKMDKDVLRITGDSAGIEPMKVELAAPHNEDAE